ncbi:hypothetical protein ACFX1X_028847 [Malus domestica]
MAAVMMTGKPLTSDVVLDETYYSDPLFCEKIKQWYRLSKTLAEPAAWKFAKGNGIDLVTIHPGFGIGPLLRPTLNLSIKFFQNLISGIETPFINYPLVDVRDIASAHIQAFEVPSAKGRYCLVAQVADGPDTHKILQQLYPTLCLRSSAIFVTRSFKCPQRKQEVWESLSSLWKRVSDTVESLKEKGFLNI